MIPRYARPRMVSIWSPETKFRIWFGIEAHATDALAELGVVPKSAAAKVWEKAGTRNSTWRGSTRSSARSSMT
jgi:adenylosuccinate lyase